MVERQNDRTFPEPCCTCGPVLAFGVPYRNALFLVR